MYRKYLETIQTMMIRTKEECSKYKSEDITADLPPTHLFPCEIKLDIAM